MRHYQTADSASAPVVGTARERELAEAQKVADAENAKKSGKGTRIRVGQTRGKNPKVISWDAFDTDKPETLPINPAEFVELTDTRDEKVLTMYLIDGFNASQYAAASDVLAEYVEPNWPDTLVKQFKQTITGYTGATGVSIEDAVALMKPGIVKAFEARLAAASQPTK